MEVYENLLKFELWGWLTTRRLNAWNRIFCSNERLPRTRDFRDWIFFHAPLAAGSRMQRSRSEVNANLKKKKNENKKKQRPWFTEAFTSWGLMLLFQYSFSTLWGNKTGTQSIQNAVLTEVRYITPCITAHPKASPATVLPDQPPAAANHLRAASTWNSALQSPETVTGPHTES